MKYYYEVMKLIEDGKPVSREVKLAMARVPHYIKTYKFNETYAAALISFIERNLYLQKGGDGLIVLQPEQKFWIEMLCFEYPDGRPVITDLPIILGAGSGKSTFLAALAIAVMLIGSKKGQDVLVFANSKRQAEELFQTSQNMIRDERSVLYQIYQMGQLNPIFHKIRYDPTNSQIEIKANDNRTADGVNVRMAIFDEFHAYTQNVIENIRKSTAPKRKLTGYTIVYSSTNGQTRGKVFDSYIDKWEKILTGEVIDDAVFPIIYKLDSVKEVMDTTKYEKAMPFIKSLSDPQIIFSMVKASKGDPVRQSELLAKTFNIPQSEYNALFTEKVLDAAIKGYEEIPRGATVYTGFDLSAVSDLSAVVNLYKDDNENYFLSGHAFIPEFTFKNKISMEQRELYQRFIDSGDLTLVSTPTVEGKQVFDYLENVLESSRLDVQKFCGDAFYNREFKSLVREEYGEDYLETVRQNARTLSEPLKNINAQMQAGHFFISSDILKWNFMNLRVKVDANNNIFPNKEKSADKIDLVSASIAAMYGWLHDGEDLQQIDWTKK